MTKYRPENDRRRSVRIRVFWLVKHAVEPDLTVFRAENIKNISRGGLAFYAEQEAKKGQVLKLYFLPPKSKKPVEAQGRVVRCRALRGEKAFEVGVEFMEMSEEATLAIDELEASFLRRQKKARS